MESATLRGVRTAATALVPRLEGTLVGRFVLLLLELRIVDRALALSSKLFVAILPLAMLCSSLLSRRASGDELVARFGLEGAGADAARALFAPPNEVRSGLGLLGALILVSSVLSFARALEAVYLECWHLPPSKAGALKRRLTWLGGLFLYIPLLPPLRTVLGDSLAQRPVGAAGFGALF